jgi:hypothetical protein
MFHSVRPWVMLSLAAFATFERNQCYCTPLFHTARKTVKQLQSASSIAPWLENALDDDAISLERRQARTQICENADALSGQQLHTIAQS